MKEKEYRTIKGTSYRWYARNWVYASEHNILLVRTNVADETYRKIAFSDLCGLTITRSARYGFYNIIFGLIALIFGLIAFSQDFTVPIVSGLAALSLCLIVINLFKGGSCRCVLSTKFSHARVRGVTRLKGANALRDFVLDRVQGMQGELRLYGESDKTKSEGVDAGSEGAAL